jgi:hypothetical protein
VAFLNWRFGLTQMTAWSIQAAPFPGLSNLATPPQKLSSPSQSLHLDMGMVMMPKKGLPRDGAMDGSMGSTSATNSDAGVKLGVPTSSRTSSAARVELPIPLYLEESVFIHTPHPRSDPQDLGERQCSTGRDVHDSSSRIFGYLPWRCYWPLTNSS